MFPFQENVISLWFIPDPCRCLQRQGVQEYLIQEVSGPEKNLKPRALPNSVILLTTFRALNVHTFVKVVTCRIFPSLNPLCEVIPPIAPALQRWMSSEACSVPHVPI